MWNEHRRRVFRSLAVAVSLAALSWPGSVQAADAADGFDRLVEAAASKVLEGAKLAGLRVPFQRAKVGPGNDEKTWWIRVDRTLPSPFRKKACEWPEDGETICYVERRKTVCSQEALAAIVGTAYDQSPKVCGGDLPIGTLPRPDGGKSPIGLYFVLAHELAHTALAHEVAAAALLAPVRGDAALRKRALRDAVVAGRRQAKTEREADTWATKIIEALLDRSIRKNGQEHASYISTVFATDLRLTFLCVDEATRCRWSEAVELPPSDGYLARESKKLVCRALTAREGQQFPVFRGSHGDWGMRLAAIQTLSSRWRKRYPADSSSPFGNLAQFVGSIEDIFGFWADHSDAYYKSLGIAVKRASNETALKDCPAPK